MQLPISIGTILQNRYRIIEILGQGGFGRTYLAEDQGRFRELCALKEFIPAQMEEYAFQKAKELFQREAAILYQLQHPQVPQFRALFEQDQRLFLVQDYVQGKTFQTLLAERKQRGYAFSETEVLLFLQQMLSVLTYVHSCNIIHRDISPDNIILREQDQLPVLIDFGVVKELATRMHLGATTQPATTVGKPGYAPPEQMQTGRAYPSSDLYGLAVTAIVLLTGREPQELLNEANLTWHWQRWIAVHPGFAQVLNRMLSPRATDRYQSAGEVLQALQTMHSAVPPNLPTQPPIPDPVPSQMATIAVGRAPAAAPSPNPQPSEPYVPLPRTGSLWDDPLSVAAVGIGLALAAGLASWAIVSALINRPIPTPTPTETIVVSPTSSPTRSPTVSPSPSPSPSPVSFSQRLRIAAGENSTVSGSLRANQTVNYLLSAEQGQQLSAAIENEGVLLTLIGPDEQPIEGSSRVNRWVGTLPFTGDYILQLRPIKGLSKADYKLAIGLQAAPSPSPSPRVDVQVIDFPAGETSRQITGQTNVSTIKRYLVNVQKGQTLNVELVDGTVTLDIRYPDGRLVEEASQILSWQAQVATGGDYQVDVVADRDTQYTLRVSVSPNENGTATPASPSP
ncbi:MAG: serine/threonine-protein kinase [Leptolyngbyaceae cyanobacterium bins.59]|nr:serine/threonine-protein kinase [Leptolyngbyaceae cyanobacterium bins.59]